MAQPDAPVASTARVSTAESDRAALVNATVSEFTARRWADDLTAMATFRPGYRFWHSIFAIADGSIAFGSAVDGRLLAVFPEKGDWARDATWHDSRLSQSLTHLSFAETLGDRRDQVVARLEPIVGPVVHNPTRGRFLEPNARRYGGFLREWGAIYERFGVPAEIGLAQAIVESGLSPTRQSAARAVGFCQWLLPNWKALNRLSPHVIEAHNQTTQASYCAAYLSVLATKYGSFIPALSEHHSGGTNVGRTLISGARLGGSSVREQYFLGSQFVRDVRRISLYGYRDIYRTYGPRSYLYAEMVFGNMVNVTDLTARMPQRRVFAMRTSRSIPLTEIVGVTRLPADEVRRFNPALLKRVPATSTLYLPSYIKEFGTDASFWHRPAPASFAVVLNEFHHLGGSVKRWDDPTFEPVLSAFQERFGQTRTEEGTVMATVLAYVIDEIRTSGRRAILAEYRSSDHVRALFDRAVTERDAGLTNATADSPSIDDGNPD